MARWYTSLLFYYVMPITKECKQQSPWSEATTFSNNYTSSGTDSYTFSYSKTQVIWTRGGYKNPGTQSPPSTMFAINSELEKYEIDYISVGRNLTSYGMHPPETGTAIYTTTVSRLVSGATQWVYIYLKYKNSFEIPLTSSGAKICKTAQKYCEKDIVVYPKLQEKTATPTSASQSIVSDSGYAGLSKVTVNPIPNAYIIPTGTKDITANGIVDVTSFAEVNVAVPAPDLSDATATPAKILLGETAYTGAGKITGTIPTYDGSLKPMTVNINATGRNFAVYDGQTASGTPVATIAAGTSGSVQCKSGYLVLKASATGFSFSQSTEGGITYVGYMDYECYKFIVTDDGIINISITGIVAE